MFSRSYTPRGRRGVPSGAASEARAVSAAALANRAKARNYVLANVTTAAKHAAPRRPASVALKSGGRTAWWLGKRLSEGAYGVTFTSRVTTKVARELERVRQASTFWMEHRSPPVGSTVVINLATDAGGRRSQGRYDACVLDNLKESSWHRYLDRAPCIQLPGVKPLCPSAYVPDFYWAGLVVDAPTGSRVFVTVMGLAKGVTMGSYLESRPLTAKLFIEVERATASLWLAGIAHADLHKENMLYDPPTGKLTIIDFGMGVKLPPDVTAALQAALPRAVAGGVRSLGEVWLKDSAYGVDVQKHVNRVMASRGYTWYNPDGTAAMRLFSLLSQPDRAAVPNLRRRAWGTRPSVTRPARGYEVTRPVTRATARAALAQAAKVPLPARATLLQAAKVPLPASRLAQAAKVPLPSPRSIVMSNSRSSASSGRRSLTPSWLARAFARVRRTRSARLDGGNRMRTVTTLTAPPPSRRSGRSLGLLWYRPRSPIVPS